MCKKKGLYQKNEEIYMLRFYSFLSCFSKIKAETIIKSDYLEFYV